MSLNYTHLIQSDPYLANQVASYLYDANANDFINNQNGTSANISYSNAGIVGNSATFNGTNSSITVPIPSGTNNFNFGTNSFCINFWIYRQSGFTGGFVISKRDASNIEWQLSFTSSIIQLQLFSANSNGNFIAVSSNMTTLPADTWTMVTFTFPGGTSRTNLKCYLNAIDRSFTSITGTYSGMATTTAPLWLGRQGNTGAGWFNGRLDNLKIWNGREFSQSEITDIYNNLY